MLENQRNQQQQSTWEKIKTKAYQSYWQFNKWAAKNPKSGWAAKISVGIFLLGIFSVFLLIFLVRVGAFGKLPTTQELTKIQNPTASEVYSEDGVLLGKYYIKNRTNVTYENLSPYIIDALISTEDARFFEHEGVDNVALLRVLFKTVLGRDLSSGGGSTLSQQLAKNLYGRKYHSKWRIPVIKIQEMHIARRLEKVYSKEELISLYLNTVPFGGNVYGIHVAANQFFSKKPADVNIEEAAMLVGMLKANTRYNPQRNPEMALERRNVVLHQMLKYDHLSQVEYDSLQATPLELEYSRDSRKEGMATYFREHLRQYLDKYIEEYNEGEGTDYNIYTDGLKIYTTLDARMQKYAEAAVGEHISGLQKDFDAHWKGQKPWGDDANIEREKRKSKRYKGLKKAGRSEKEINAIFAKPVKMTIFDWQKGDIQKAISPLDSIKYYYCLLNAGFLAMEPQNGHIKAWVGGIDYEYYQYDHVKSKRQVGSTFKPIVYSTALQQGVEPCEYTHNRLVIYSDYDDWKPQNANNKYGGVYSMQGALTHSVNSVTVSTIMQAQVDSVIQLAHQMGIKSEIPAVPAIALGAVDASLYEMVNVYGTLANYGVRPEPLFVTRIEDSEGNVLIDFTPDEYEEWERILTEENATVMIEMMQSVVDSGTARRLRYQYHLENDIAGKTGTTQNQSDGWFIGFTPHIVGGAWVGGESPSVRFRSLSLGSGSNMALPIWGRFMNKVYKDKAFSNLQLKSFRPLSDSLQMRLDCAPFLEEMPKEELAQFPEDIIEDEIDSFINILKKKAKRINEPPTKRRSPKTTSRNKRSEEIRKENERKRKKKQRKKKTKKFLDKIFN